MRRGFTLIETLVVLGIIALLVGLVLVGLSGARNTARRSAAQQAVNALKIGVEQYRSDLGFLPPLVKDGNKTPHPSGTAGYYAAVFKNDYPLEQDASGRYNPVVFNMSLSEPNRTDRDYLRGQHMRKSPDIADRRFSVFSLSYNLVGALGKLPSGDLPDGVDGPGFRTPSKDGSFARSGATYQPLYDPGSSTTSIVDTAPDHPEYGRIELRDRDGVAIRYYRWHQGDPDAGARTVINSPEDFNVPAILGDPAENTSLRSAGYAIVAAGPDGVFGDVGRAANMGTEPLEKVLTAANLSDTGTDPDAERLAEIRRRASEDNAVALGEK